MKKDAEVNLLHRERKKGRSQEIAAARAGMSVVTARKYERAGKLPSQLRKPRTHRTRPDPFDEDWPWVQRELERDAALQAKVLFELLCQAHPDRYQPGQLRTLQRRIERWRAMAGPDREVMFEQIHEPGRMAQSDFTVMDALAVTIAGEPFAHLYYHLVLTYSNHEAVKLCFSETFEALAEGIEACVWQIGGVPRYHRTDNLSAAVRVLDAEGKRDWTERYEGLMRHYGMTPTRNTPGESHQNGDIEQAHHRFKDALDQALRVRGSRDFESRAAYETLVQEVVRRRNDTRRARYEQDLAALSPLPAAPLAPCRQLTVSVSRFSTVRVLENTYSVPSRLIGNSLTVRVRAEILELYLGASPLLTLPRLKGRQQFRIDYRHVIWSLVRKPGAFAAYRFRSEFFPTTTFRRTYDALADASTQRCDLEYLRILHLAAGTSEHDVEIALGMLLEAGETFGFDEVRELVNGTRTARVPAVAPPRVDLSAYDRLLEARVSHG
jgi:hypothetical protein